MKRDLFQKSVGRYAGPEIPDTLQYEGAAEAARRADSSSSARRGIAKLIPLDRLLLETDNPGGYEWLTKSIGMPAVIRDVLAKVAQIRGMDPLELESHVYENWLRMTEGIAELEQPAE